MLLSPFFISCYVDMVDQGIHLAQNLKRKKETFEAFRQAQTQKLGEYLLTQDFLINNSIFFSYLSASGISLLVYFLKQLDPTIVS